MLKVDGDLKDKRKRTNQWKPNDILEPQMQAYKKLATCTNDDYKPKVVKLGLENGNNLVDKVPYVNV